MRRAILQRLFLLLLIIPLLGISPRDHQVSRELKQASLAMAASSLPDAAAHLANAAERNPWRADLWELGGNYALQAGDFNAAIRYFERASAADGSARILTLLGEAYSKTGDLNSAVRVWKQAAEKSDAPAGIYLRLFQAHKDLGDYPGAVADLQALTVIQPNEARWHYQLGLHLAALDPQAALSALDRAVSLDADLSRTADGLRRNIQQAQSVPDKAYQLLIAGRALALLGEWKLATEAFRGATRERPDYAEAWAYLGEALQHPTAYEIGAEAASRSNSENDESLEALQKALALDPQSLAAQTFLALYHTRRGQYDQAVQVLQQAASLDPQNPVLQAELGNNLALVGDLAAAYRAYQRALELAPDNIAYLRLMVGFSLKYDYDIANIALPAARRVMLLAPEEATSLNLMAEVLIELDDLVTAERLLQSALSYDPQNAESHLHLGRIHILKGDGPKAYQELTLAARLASGGPVAEQAQRLLRTYFP